MTDPVATPIPTTILTTATNDSLTSYRLTQMEQQNTEMNGKIDTMQKDLSGLKDSITSEFAALKKTLFERPLFVTFELLKVELESRDRAINSIQVDKDKAIMDLKVDKDKDITDLKKQLETMSANTVSTSRHYLTLLITVACVFVAPFISDYLGRLS